MQTGFFKTFDGTRLFYSVEGSGPPLLFCYGLVCSKLHWSYQMEYFKRKHSVIWFDYRGHHRSDSPEKPEQLTIANIARDIECLLDELKLPKVTLLGHSMGVNLVLDFYRRAPHRVEAMVLANGSARGPLQTLLRTNLIEIAFPYIFAAHRKYPKLVNLLWAAQGKSRIAPWLVGQLGFNPNLAKPEDVRVYVKMVSEMDMIITLQLLKDYDGYDATSWLHRVSAPTLVIAGENDLIIPKEAQETMHQLIPGSRFELIRRGSHCPQMDIPELVNIIIERFFGEIGLRQPGERGETARVPRVGAASSRNQPSSFEPPSSRLSDAAEGPSTSSTAISRQSGAS